MSEVQRFRVFPAAATCVVNAIAAPNRREEFPLKRVEPQAEAASELRMALRLLESFLYPDVRILRRKEPPESLAVT